MTKRYGYIIETLHHWRGLNSAKRGLGFEGLSKSILPDTEILQIVSREVSRINILI